MRLKDLVRISEYEWEIPKDYRSDMRVPVRIFATRELLEAVLEDKSLEQAVNAATLPGVVGRVLVMPDVHQGYGFPIGGVAATKYPEGIISPGGIGYDINCGVRLLATRLPYEKAEPYLDTLATLIDQYCPSGVGRSGHVKISTKELDRVAREGARWALQHGYATKEDLERTEEGGRLPHADPSKVSGRAKERGRTQLGTVGAGNHFIEVDVIEQIFDEEAARAFGLEEGMLAVQIHCGSRGYGHQICSDYVRDFQKVVHRYGIRLPDRELVCAPLNSPEGQDYLGAMQAAANFAFCNRQILAHFVRRAFEETFRGKARQEEWYPRQVYDLAHNIGKIEVHDVDGKRMKVCVHRKGATRAFGPHVPGVPAEYREVGQPVLVPGSMGTASWVLVGTEDSMKKTFGSSCHGAGRVMSRAKAKKTVRGEKLLRQLEGEGIRVRAGSMRGLAEEAPFAYKDVDLVVETVVGAGIARKVARLRPVAVIKG